jgi:hypothetical protein
MEDIKSSLDGLAPAVQQLEITQHHKLSNLENILKSAVIRGLKRHNDELRTDRSPKFAKTVATNQPVINTCWNNENGPNDYNMIRGPRSIHRSRFQTPIFDIEFVTKEAQRRPAPPLQSLSTVPSEEDLTNLQRFTTYKIRIKTPAWGSELSFEPGSLHTRYCTNFHKCLRFRMYNIVPWDSPIIQACQNFDLPEARRLFEEGHASPQDCLYLSNESLVAIVFIRLFSTKCGSLTEATKGVELLKFLIYCLGGDIGFPGWHFFSAFRFKECISESQHPMELGEKWTEAFRLGLAHSSEDPFEGWNIAKRLSIRFSQTPIYSVLMAQQKWWINTQVEDSCIIDERTHFFETNLQILKDPLGLAMQKAMARGDGYVPYVSGSRPGADHSPIHSLLRIAATTFQEDLHKCVLARLSILLQNEYQPHDAYRVHDFSQSFYPSENVPAMLLSCTGYADYLDLTDLWKSALEATLWTPAKIQHLFDADVYAGVPELLGGTLVYQTRGDQRATFMHKLLRGDFTGLEDGTILTISIVLQNELGVWWAGVNQMIRDVDNCFKIRTIPGGWPTDRSRGLVPGIDFKLPSGGEFDDTFDDVKDWKCIQEIWEEELDGYDCSLPREKYAGRRDRLLEQIRYSQSRVRYYQSQVRLLSSKTN